MSTVFNEKSTNAGAGVVKRTTPENEGAGYAIVMGVVVPVGGGPGGVTRRTSADTAPLAEQTATDQGITERTTL